ncbi:TonB-dependent receptor [Mitsuaria sp. TWR114]|uniref:TonB-dependent receptor n=1 Tax=Mitsuaria sp. TWR114 TaxID=2601731 RepID=UPI00164C5029|nr:TonB-dependent receptor [Mitsuaria sp. TWR114]
MSRQLTHRALALTSIAIASTLACGVAVAQESKQLERVEVTGSNIKRIDAETVSPVQIISRDQIERTGQPTVADVLRNLPSNTGSLGESFSNSFAPGAAGFSLRGLGQKTTLVLLNGRRVAGYGFAQNLQDTFVDLNSIPSAAVQRIDILKDGASAIYGSDAIAGVVNIILRKDYQGFDISASGGFFEGKNDYRVTAAGGFGDLGSDGYNIFATLDYYKRDLLLQKDVEFTESRDFRKYAGGRNYQSLTGGGTWREVAANGTLTNNYRAISDCKGTVINGQQALAAGLINPNTAANIAMTAASNTYCMRDFKDEFTALPGTERIGLLTRGTKVFSPNATGYFELGLSRSDTTQTFQSASFVSTGLTTVAGQLQPFSYTANFAPGVAGNPFSNRARYVGVLNDMGTRDNEIRSDSLRAVAGVSYTIGSWDFDSAVGYSSTDTTSKNLNRLTLAGTSAAFGIPTSAQPPVPLSSASSYNLDKWTTNSQAVRDSMRGNFDRKSKSEMTFVDTKANTTVGQMAGGDIGLAIGAEFREEKLKDTPAEIAASGGIIGQGITATNGRRDNISLFSEISMPFTKKLEVQAAIRYDKYSDYGTSTTPKLGAKFQALDSLLFRANWGKGFRAPTLPEISPSAASFFQSVIDPQDGVTRQISGVFAGNPNLKAEKSTSTTIGFVFEPTKNFNFGVDFYKINWRNVVASRNFQDILDESCPNGGTGADPTQPNCPSTPTIIRDGNPQTNQIITILSNYENLSSRKTSGVDIDGTLRVPTSLGKFTFRGNLIYVSSFKEDGVQVVGTNGGANTIPRIRAGFSTDFDYGPWSVTAGLNYTHHVRQELLAASYFTPQDPRFQTGVFPTHVRSNTTMDLFGRYAITKQLTASVSVLNVFNRMPPHDPGFSSTSLYDFSLYDTRGRQFRATLSYSL